MTHQTKRTAYRFFLAVCLLSLIVTACNNKKDKKGETTTQDTTVIEPVPLPPVKDTTGMDKDTADTRPITPVDPVKPGE